MNSIKKFYNLSSPCLILSYSITPIPQTGRILSQPAFPLPGIYFVDFQFKYLPNGKSCDRIMNVVSASRHVGMADEADSKSVDGNIVWVQVPLPALHPWQGARLPKADLFWLWGVFSLCPHIFPTIPLILHNILGKPDGIMIY